MAFLINTPIKNVMLNVALQAIDLDITSTETRMMAVDDLSAEVSVNYKVVAYENATNATADISANVELDIQEDKTVHSIVLYTVNGEIYRTDLPVAEYFEFGGKLIITSAAISLNEV